MAELEDSGMLKEWWANPAVVGLMGFGLTTMATGLHNVGYWSAGPTLALAISVRRHGAIHCGHRGPSKRKHLRWFCLHVVRRVLVVVICVAVRAAEDGHPGGSSRGTWVLPHVDAVHISLLRRRPGRREVSGGPLLAALAGLRSAGLRGFRQVSGGGCGVGDLYRRPDRLVYRNGDVGEYSLQKEGSTTFLKSRIRVRKGASILWETRCLRPP